ncbi:sigma factor-like helix-turn-helix DNA-binding protein [Variovorax gossypii]
MSQNWPYPGLPSTELLRWGLVSDLDEAERRAVRRIVVQRGRSRSNEVWARPCGVQLSSGWQETIAVEEVGRLAALLMASSRRLEEHSLKEVKQALRVPQDQVLGVLARLEANYWNAPGEPSTVKLEGELRARADRALALRWLPTVHPDDIRFPFIGEAGGLEVRLRALLATPQIGSDVVALIDQLLAADAMTAAQEVAAITAAARPSSRPSTLAERSRAIFLARYLSAKGEGRTLVEVGQIFDLTRERVRQICSRFEEALARARIATPAIDRVLECAARIAPSPIEDVDEQFARFIGEGAGARALLSFKRMIGHAAMPVSTQRTRRKVKKQRVDVTIVDRPDNAPWIGQLLRIVVRDSSMFGSTNILRVAGMLALEHEIAPGREAIESALSSSEGLRWLDRPSGWFAIGDASGSAVATRVRKIMATAEGPVGTDAIAAALASDTRWMERENVSLGLATPPPHVLRELLLGWTWLRVVQSSRFEATPEFNREGALSEAEQVALRVIASNGGIACRFEITAVVKSELDLTDIYVSMILASSPVFLKIEHGLYRAIGRRVSDSALANARARLSERAGRSVPEKSDAFRARVTDASLRNEQYGVPANLLRTHSGLRNSHPELFLDASQIAGRCRINASGVISGIHRHFPGIATGDILEFRLLVTIRNELALQVNLFPSQESSQHHTSST